MGFAQLHSCDISGLSEEESIRGFSDTHREIDIEEETGLSMKRRNGESDQLDEVTLISS